MTATDRPTSGPATAEGARGRSVASGHAARGEPGSDDGPDAALDVEDVRSPRWPWIVGIVLTVAGIAVATNLTYAHYTSTAALGACPDTGFINCAKVTTSSYSHIFGLPVAVLGLAFFVGMLPLQLPWAWRSQWAPLRLARLGATVVGVGMIMWLVYVELFRLDSICLYCTAVHVLTVLLFISTALGTVATAVYADEA